MKRKFSIFSLLILPLILLNGCNAFSNGHESVKPSSSSLDSTSYSSQEDYEKALYNRIILDYYEQRINNQKTKGSNMYFSEIYDEIPALSEIRLHYIISKSKKGAYLVGFNQLGSFGRHYYFAYNENSISFDFIRPFVWYDSKIFYLNDAFYSGLFSNEEINDCLNEMNNNSLSANDWLLKSFSGISYDESVEPLTNNNQTVDISSAFYQLREDTFTNYIAKSADFAGYNIVLDDIHVYQSFAKVKNVYAVNFSIDGISPPKYLYSPIQKQWNTSLVIGQTIIEPFQEDMPVVWINRNFYYLDNALNNDLINQETAIELLRQYKISAKHENGTVLVG